MEQFENPEERESTASDQMFEHQMVHECILGLRHQMREIDQETSGELELSEIERTLKTLRAARLKGAFAGDPTEWDNVENAIAEEIDLIRKVRSGNVQLLRDYRDRLIAHLGVEVKMLQNIESTMH